MDRVRVLYWRWQSRGDSGQAMVEYAIVTALIAVVALAAVQAMGTSVVSVFTNIVNAIKGI